MYSDNAILTDLWRKCCEHLQQEIPPQEYSTWVSPLQLRADCNGNALRLCAPNAFIRDVVREQYLPWIRRALRRLNRPSLAVQLEVSAPADEAPADVPPSLNDSAPEIMSQPYPPVLPPPGPASAPPPARRPVRHNGGAPNGLNGTPPAGHPALDDSAAEQLRSQTRRPPLPNTARSAPAPRSASRPGPRPTPHKHRASNGLNGRNGASTPTPTATRPLNSAYTLESFVQGDSNRMACAAAKAVIDHCGAPAHNPLVFYGGVGLGKTHLMHAVGNALLRKNPRIRVVYFSSEDFVNRLITAIRLQATDTFRAQYRDQVDVLLIDDVQFFADKDASETEAFNTIDTLSETGRQIVITCDRYPGDLGAMEARLRSRIGRGLSVALEAPDLETRAAILMSKALQVREPISEEIALFIARHIDSNVRELEGALNRVIAAAKFAVRPIDMEMTRRALADMIAGSGRGPTIQDIKKRTADYFHVRVSDMDSPSRKASHVRPRQIAMSLARDLTRHSLPEIGEHFGGRDHTTVLHACNRIKRLRAENPEFETDYNRLLRELNE